MVNRLTNVAFNCKVRHYTAVDGSNVTAAGDGDDGGGAGARLVLAIALAGRS